MYHMNRGIRSPTKWLFVWQRILKDWVKISIVSGLCYQQQTTCAQDVFGCILFSPLSQINCNKISTLRWRYFRGDMVAREMFPLLKMEDFRIKEGRCHGWHAFIVKIIIKHNILTFTEATIDVIALLSNMMNGDILQKGYYQKICQLGLQIVCPS